MSVAYTILGVIALMLVASMIAIRIAGSGFGHHSIAQVAIEIGVLIGLAMLVTGVSAKS